MNIVLWNLQGILAAAFIMAGSMKLAKSKDELKQQGSRMAWVENISAPNIKLIGLVELLGGIGLILPQLTGILPVLTPVAALGLVLVMTGAMSLHIRRAEGGQPIMANLILLLLAAIIASGRFMLVPV